MTKVVGAISFVTARLSFRGDATDVPLKKLAHSTIIGRRCSK
jgi:hypothetical protein